VSVQASGVSPAIVAAIERAAKSTGTDFSLLMATARRESAFNPAARAATSSATGLYQFIDQTWLTTVKRYGARHGMADIASEIRIEGGRAIVDNPARRREILNLRLDPELSARMAGELTRENADFLARRLGRTATPGELYAAHVLGPGGAIEMINAAQAGGPGRAADVLPAAARSNQALFSHRDGRARSPAELLQRLDVVREGVSGGLTVPLVMDKDGKPAPLPMTLAGASDPDLPGLTIDTSPVLLAQLMMPSLSGMLNTLLSSPEDRDEERRSGLSAFVSSQTLGLLGGSNVDRRE
jgi:hypothetical protein